MFSINSQSALELNEFRPGVDRDLSGLHFSGSGTASFHRFCDIRQASRFDCNTKVTRSSATTMASGAVFDGQGYNTLTMGTYTEQGTTEFTNLPGAIAVDAGFTSPEDFSINHPFGTNQANGPVATIALDTEANYF